MSDATYGKKEGNERDEKEVSKKHVLKAPIKRGNEGDQEEGLPRLICAIVFPNKAAFFKY